MRVNAIVLTGGRSRRFAGVHKPGVTVQGTPTIARIVSAVGTLPTQAVQVGGIWVVGPLDGLGARDRDSVHQVFEQPRYSGPLSAIAAAVSDMPDDSDTTILVLAGDVPFVSTTDIARLTTTSTATGRAAGCVDPGGRFQQLFAAWPAGLLRTRLDAIGDPANQPVRRLWEGIEPALVDVSPESTDDFDTPDDLRRIQARATEADARVTEEPDSRLP